MHDDVKARDIVVPILERVLGPLGLDSIEVNGDLDHDGDPILLAVARYKRGAGKLDGRALLDAVVSALDALSKQGDDRFLHVRNLFADGEPAAPDDGSYARAPRRKNAAA